MRSPILDCTALRQRRESLGISQSELASRAGLSRQTVSAIETGRAVPALDIALQIAAALSTAVESLFQLQPARPRRSVLPVSLDEVAAQPGSRVVLAQLGDRVLSYTLSRERLTQPADGVLRASRGGSPQVELYRGAESAHDTFVLAGCAPALGLLAESLNRQPGAARYLWLPASSTGALRALGDQHVHLAGVHLSDPRTGEANLADVQSHSGRGARLLFTLARWELGLVLPAGNPRRLRRLSQVLTSCFGARASAAGGRTPRPHRRQPPLRLLSREPGSGVHRFLMAELTEAGLPAARLLSRLPSASGQLEVAQAIALGAADVGIATRDAALAYKLDFVPLRQERYDLVLPSELLRDPRATRLLDTLTSAPFRRDLAALGYDSRPCGSRVAEVEAA